VARPVWRRAGFLESLAATYIAGVIVLALLITPLLGVTFTDAVRLSVVGVGALMAVYVLNVGFVLARRRLAPRGVARRPGAKRAKSAHQGPRLSRGKVRHIDRRAGQRIRHHAALLARKRAQCWDPQARNRTDEAKWAREQDAFIDDVLLEGVPDAHKKALKRRGRLIAAWRRRIDAAVDEQDRARANIGRGIHFKPGMEGFEYEAYVSRVLSEHGWKVWNKGDSGDQGVDVVAEGYGVIVAIQCKRYQGSVGNSAVQEIYAGRLIIDPRARAAVCTNAEYTRSAKQLAAATGVLLLHHDDLPKLSKLVAKPAPQQQQKQAA
jgi:restriction system protein